GHNRRRHTVLDRRRTGIATLGDHVHTEIAVGDNADDLAALVIDHRYHAGILVTHDARGALRGIRRYAAHRILRHDMLDLHRHPTPWRRAMKKAATTMPVKMPARILTTNAAPQPPRAHPRRAEPAVSAPTRVRRGARGPRARPAQRTLRPRSAPVADESGVRA